MRSRFVRPRNFAAILLIVILSVVAYGFAASNTFGDTTGATAGDGATTINGYTITNVQYNLDASNPSVLDTTGGGVTFDIAGATIPVTVEVYVDSTAGYTSCSVSGATSPWAVSCDITSAVVDMDELRVIAVGN